jgi:hypothetical protein
VIFVVALIGIVSFDGFSAGALWIGWTSDIASAFETIGLSPVRSIEATFGLGLIAAILLMLALYRLAAWGAHNAGGGFSSRYLALTFAHSLAPIALVYAAACWRTTARSRSTPVRGSPHGRSTGCLR